MKIILEMNGDRYTYESPLDNMSADELKEMFSRLMVLATFPPSVIQPAEGGHYECEYKEENETKD